MPPPVHKAGIAAAAIAVAFSAAPARAWQAGFDGPICTLTHSGEAAEVVLTYDPRLPLYSITVTRDRPWPAGPLFGIRFDGPRGNLITTDRHERSGDGLTLSVTDRGFGNVLNGLEFNTTAFVLIGDAAVSVSLDGAAPEVQAFRDCGTAPLS